VKRVYCEIEGSCTTSMAKSIGLAVQEFVTAFDDIDPDVVIVIGDRYEALGAAIAATYTDRILVHFQGGEVSGSRDEITRHAITKMAHYHVPATLKARENILRMGEKPVSILGVGCPSIDLMDYLLTLGNTVDDVPDYLCIYHPTPEEDAKDAFEEIYKALQGIDGKTLWLWPNIDPGSQELMAVMRQKKQENIELQTNLHPSKFYEILSRVKCCFGNSSSFVRDAGFFGTPVVLIGDRQSGREMAENVFTAPCKKADILLASYGVQSAGGEVDRYKRYHRGVNRFPTSDLYGRPGISEEIARKLPDLEHYHKKICY